MGPPNHQKKSWPIGVAEDPYFRVGVAPVFSGRCQKRNFPLGRSRDKSKDIKMCSVLALVGVDAHKKFLSHFVNWLIR